MKKLIEEKCAFLFQGVGPEYQKFLHLLGEKEQGLLKHYCTIANKEIGLDLWSYLFEFSPTKYDKMFNDWIAIYTCDYIVYHAYTDLGIKPDILLGYSMGLITAMACGKSISYEAGLQMLLTIYEYPKYFSRNNEAMSVIVGMTYDDVDKIIRGNKLEGYVEIASENNEYCIIISGIKKWVDRVMSIAVDEGALKVKDINAPYAFHSRHAAIGIERYIELVAKLEVLDSEISIISSFNQDIIKTSDELKEELVKNMTSRMYWKSSIEKIVDIGINNFVEVSLADSVTKFSKLINTDSKFVTYKKMLKLKSLAEKVIA
ncbi:ACP S-malonyltransferase [Wukongibacter sp. M2B1]|uniref:ACP S-malonyltransferase n=1 Tax=Wukongibacter sp. M2B1 TaxID=3088895 RepID=UPI003D7B7C75